MPELPEVEVVRMGLEAQLRHAEIEELEILNAKVVGATAAQQEALKGQRFRGFRRRAKYLILDLDHHCLLIHLRMTGQLLVIPADTEQAELLPLPFTYYQRPLEQAVDKHTHGLFHLTDGRRLAYRDVRKFGRVLVLEPQELARFPGLLKLGPEPLSKAFKRAPFERQLLSTSRAIKAFLLDQSKVAGLGNIYVDEALFLARVQPERPANQLKPAERKRLYAAIPFVLQKGIDAGGTSLKDYLHPDGQRGSHQEHLFVYGRGGQDCLMCETPLIKTVVAQRGTHYCPRCQK